MIFSKKCAGGWPGGKLIKQGRKQGVAEGRDVSVSNVQCKTGIQNKLPRIYINVGLKNKDIGGGGGRSQWQRLSSLLSSSPSSSSFLPFFQSCCKTD